MINTCISELYNKHQVGLRNFIFKRVADSDITNDLLQEIFLKITEYCGKGKTCRHSKAFLYRVAINVMMDHFRKEKKSELLLKIFPFEFEEEGVQNLLNLEMIQCVTLLIDELPSPYCDTLRKSDLENRKQKEIAHEMGISLPAVKSRVLRARSMLRNRLNSYCAIDSDCYGNILTCKPK